MQRQLSSENVVRCSDPVDEVIVKTADISSKFKFFETYKPPETKRKAFRITPPREGQLLQVLHILKVLQFYPRHVTAQRAG